MRISFHVSSLELLYGVAHFWNDENNLFRCFVLYMLCGTLCNVSVKIWIIVQKREQKREHKREFDVKLTLLLTLFFTLLLITLLRTVSSRYTIVLDFSFFQNQNTCRRKAVMRIKIISYHSTSWNGIW